MRIRQISSYMKDVEDKWYITDEGDVYVRLKKYSRSYRMIVGVNEQGHRVYKGITADISKFNSEVYPCYLYDNKQIILLEGKIPLEIRYYKPNEDGYIYFSSKGKPIAVHRAVAICFNNCSIEDNIHHKNGNKTCNYYWNLEGLSNSEHVSYHNKKDKLYLNLINYERKSKYKSFTLITPQGLKYHYTDIHKCCLEHNLNEVGLLNILSGYRNSYKKYKVEDVILNSSSSTIHEGEVGTPQ